MVYMGSKTGEDPDDILKQNHQMLAAVHRGRSELRINTIFLLENSSLFPYFLYGVFLFFLVGICLTVLNKPKLPMFIAIDMVSEVSQPS